MLLVEVFKPIFYLVENLFCARRIDCRAKSAPDTIWILVFDDDAIIDAIYEAACHSEFMFAFELDSGSLLQKRKFMLGRDAYFLFFFGFGCRKCESISVNLRALFDNCLLYTSRCV